MKTSVDTFGTNSCVPVEAVVFYSTDGKKGDERGVEFATVHAVARDGSGQSRLGPGRPITIEAMKKVAKQFGDQLKVKTSILREQVLLSTDDLLVWWTPACTRLCFFDIDWHQGQKGRDKLQGVSANLPIPPLVWALQRTNGRGIWQGLHIWALAENARPTADTPLLRAPLLNLDDDGRVCWGSGAVPKHRSQDDIEAWQEAFFASVFSHYNESTPFKGAEAYEVLAAMVKRPPKTFPSKFFIPMREKLGQAVQRVSEKQ